jgi:UDP-GlcNAc:undecaprenyl-phosphate GlcNAc-1-phosphate transferase
MCIGVLPHNFHPARIFMGDTGSMLIGMMLAYAPIQSFASLDPNLLTYYNSSTLHPINRFPTFLPLILPIAIWLIPYADLLLAVIRRTAAGQSPFAADRKHLHHRLQGMGHSHRRTVLLMYLWTALFAGGLVGLSQLHISLVWLVLVTLFMVVALLVATMPRLRPWRRHGRTHAALADAAVADSALSGTAAPDTTLSRTALAGPMLSRTVLNDTVLNDTVLNDTGASGRSAETAEAGHDAAVDLPPRRAARRGAGA